ncbi:translation inhibitor protein RaiA [Campylobacter blaseri]|uniref:Ribosome hibernation promoting factor n=1 Tax=Campylobacter blaseri TaxID=2042961 RepID=A0A2P8R225_9BACT|nr:ribosome-associated translation inhibitor RaiA [Campylobacter blaseri]PSM52528.1 ribosomal subunit interface protein [Campylobacter blaseri]PSM54176.1 ribosomal subunit interface protein [Campylobacter blaseri]QKF85826.1 translation inhibitor protein RaiA [Campylobacter blaseri]
MNISITGKQFELTESIKNYIVSAFESFEKYNLDIISIRCVISADEKKGRKGFVVDLALNLARKDTIVISGKDKDLYAAIDSIATRASKVLRRHHDKNITVKNKDEIKEQLLDMHDAITSEELEDIDEIVPMELEIYKPLEIEEALSILKSDDTKQFLVFYDMDAKLRVLYRRKDGKFGLY